MYDFSKKLLILFYFVFLFFNSGCSTFNAAVAKTKAESACGISHLDDPTTVEQVECMDKAGENDPNYQSMAYKIKEIKDRQSREFEAALDKCIITSANFRPPIGGILQVPAGMPEFVVTEKLKRFCSKHSNSRFEIIRITENRNYVGSQGGASATCSSFGCFGSSSSYAVYQYYTDIEYECL